MKLCGGALLMHVVTYLLATATDAGFTRSFASLPRCRRRTAAKPPTPLMMAPVHTAARSPLTTSLRLLLLVLMSLLCCCSFFVQQIYYQYIATDIGIAWGTQGGECAPRAKTENLCGRWLNLGGGSVLYALSKTVRAGLRCCGALST